MIKKISAFLIALALCIAFPLAVLADGSAVKLIDDAKLLSEAEYQDVLLSLEQVSEKYGVDVAVLTTNGTGGQDIVSFADDYYDNHGYGTGDDKSGALLVLDMESRQWYITTSGEGISAFTDYGIQQCGEELVGYLSGGDYAGAFKKYAETADYYFSQERAGTPVDHYEEPETEPEPQERTAGEYAAGGVVSVGAGFGLSFAATAGMKRKMKSVRPQTTANAYADEHGLQLTENTDRYLYHRIVAVPLPRNDGPRNTGMGGGSSVHMSSGGQMHGGGGGHF